MLHLIKKIIFLQSSLCDFLLYPVKNTTPIFQIVWLAALTGILMVVLYWLFSNQTAIRIIKNKIKCHFLEIRIYKNDIKETVLAQKMLFRANFRYIWLVLKPGTVLVFVVVFILLQLHARFSFAPIKDKTSISITMSVPTSRDDVKIILPKGVKKDSPLVFIPSNSEFNWRLLFDIDGIYNIGFRLKNGEVVSKQIIAGNTVAAISPARTCSLWSSIFDYPTSKFLSNSSNVEKIYANFPEREIRLTKSKSYNWIFIFFPVAMIFGLFFKTIAGIE